MQVQLVPLALTNVTPAGSVSVSVSVEADDGPPFVIVIAYARLLLATTGSGESVIVSARFALGFTVVTEDRELFEVVGSNVGDAIDAVFVIVPVAVGAVTWTEIGELPVAMVARVHVTTPELCEHVHPVPEALPNTVPAGSVSVTVTSAAALGPLLNALIVYDSAAPASTGSGESVMLEIRRSALGSIVVVAVAELFDVSGSELFVDNTAVFENELPVLGAASISVTVVDAPGSRRGSVHVTVVTGGKKLGGVHVHPVPVACVL